VRRNRKWDRFFATSARQVRAKIVNGFDRNSAIHSVGLGGCGFIGNRSNAKLLQHPKVRVEFQIASEKLVIEGTVQYCQLMPHRGIDQNMLGIQFSWQDKDQSDQFKRLLGEAARTGILENPSEQD